MNPGIIALMIPIMALAIPIVAILVNHQQRMAQIIHESSKGRLGDADVAALRDEIRALREAVNEQALAIESVRDLRVPDVQDRLRSKV